MKPYGEEKSIVFPEYFLCTLRCSNAGGTLYSIVLSNLFHIMAHRENYENFHSTLRQADEAVVCPEETAEELELFQTRPSHPAG